MTLRGAPFGRGSFARFDADGVPEERGPAARARITDTSSPRDWGLYSLAALGMVLVVDSIGYLVRVGSGYGAEGSVGAAHADWLPFFAALLK
ncbi:hypothetical protein ACWGKQ_13220 [Streptomyces sp. NPDC054770]